MTDADAEGGAFALEPDTDTGRTAVPTPTPRFREGAIHLKLFPAGFEATSTFLTELEAFQLFVDPDDWE